MFINITSNIDTKYLVYSSGQCILRLDPSKDIFHHIRLGIYKSPTVIEEYDNTTGMYEVIPYKNISLALQSIGICAKNTNSSSLEDFVITRDSNKISYFSFSPKKNHWIRKTIQLPFNESCTSITCVPNGFLIGNSRNPPLLLESSKDELKLGVENIDFDNRLSIGNNKFFTRSIINFKGLINGLDGVILNGTNETFYNFYHQYIFQIDKNKILIEPWIENVMLNSTSATFVNVNPSKEIYGLLIGNYGADHILYLFKNHTFISKTKIAGSYAICVLAADFDNDGHDEIFILNYRQHNQLYRVLDETNIEPIQLAQAYTSRYSDTRANSSYTSSVVMDLDNDGFLELFNTAGEIFLGNGLFKVAEIFKKNHNYLRVFPKNPNGSPHRGAVVIIKFSGKKYKRIIDNGGNAYSQSEPIAHFGLGNYNGPVNILIKWTDGTKTKHKNIKPNQVFTVKK